MIQNQMDMSLQFYTDDPALPRWAITDAALTMGKFSAEKMLEYALREYIVQLMRASGYQRREIAIDIPSLVSRVPDLLYGGYEEHTSGLYMRPMSSIDAAFHQLHLDARANSGMRARFTNIAAVSPWLEPIAPPAPAPEFEVNMMEALVGWKGWKLVDGMLTSPSYNGKWKPDEAFAAKCGSIGDCCPQVVQESNINSMHMCGVHAADTLKGAKIYGALHGQVYGWGRYVRGDKGWRAQFAYPKSFHLTSEQAEFIEPLKRYHVDIYIDQPLRMYDPEEEGYGYGNTEAHRYRGTIAATGPTQEGSADAGAAAD